jgi:hypothetical protein
LAGSRISSRSSGVDSNRRSIIVAFAPSESIGDDTLEDNGNKGLLLIAGEVVRDEPIESLLKIELPLVVVGVDVVAVMVLRDPPENLRVSSSSSSVSRLNRFNQSFELLPPRFNHPFPPPCPRLVDRVPLFPRLAFESGVVDWLLGEDKISAIASCVTAYAGSDA